MKINWTNHMIELVIVILGISIAFWLNERSEESKEAQTRNNYLSEITSDMASDLVELDYVIEVNTKKFDGLMAAAQLFSKADQHREMITEQALTIGNYYFFTPENFTYQSMMASGDFKLIEEPGIKRSLIALHAHYDFINVMQQNFIQALDEGYFPYLLENFDYISMTAISPEFHGSQTLKNYFVYTINELDLHIKQYQRARLMAHRLDSLISVQLN